MKYILFEIIINIFFFIKYCFIIRGFFLIIIIKISLDFNHANLKLL